MESVIERKNNSLLLVILLLLLIGVSGYVVYDKVLKKDVGTSEKQDVLTNDLAIALVKEKLDIANKYLNDERYRGEEYSKTGEGSMFYEYKSVDEFKKEFYSIYSSRLVYEDVIGEQDLSVNKKNAADGVSSNLPIDDNNDSMDSHLYAIKDNNVYVDSCTMGSAGFKRMGDYEVESITSDTIKVNYSIYMYAIEPGISDEEYKYEKDGKITLVKENGEWKILNAVVASGLCGNINKVGK